MHYFIKIEPHAVYLACCETEKGVQRLEDEGFIACGHETFSAA